MKTTDIILDAIEVANRRLGRVAKAAEVAACIPPARARRIRANYVKDIRDVVTTFAGVLINRGDAFTNGKVNGRRYYGSPRVLDPVTAPLPSVVDSRSTRVLAVARRAVNKLGRGVRASDIMEHATSAELTGLTQELVGRALGALVADGRLKVIHIVRSRASNIYLPSELDVENFPEKPSTLYQKLEETFMAVWNLRLESARACAGKPAPLTTGEIGKALRSRHGISDTQWVANALEKLASEQGAQIRKVLQRNSRVRGWVAAAVNDADLDLRSVMASDTDRVTEAVARAEQRFKRPVSAAEIKRELQSDARLHLVGTQSTGLVLQDASKKTLSAYSGGRAARRHQRVHQVGAIGGRAYYTTKHPQAGRAFVRFQQINKAWKEADLAHRVRTLDEARLRSVALGRTLLLKEEATEIELALQALCADRAARSELMNDAKRLLAEVRAVLAQSTAWLDRHEDGRHVFPAEVKRDIPCWSNAEFLEVMRGVYPYADRITVPQHLTNLVGRRIRRFRVRPDDHRNGALPRNPESQYDRADALLYAATMWGGHESAAQAALARAELDHLRDVRFVLPGLDERDAEHRLVAVACLAFLPCDEGRDRLRSVAIADPDPGVREAALWAFGFSGGSDALELLRERSATDPNARTRRFAATALSWDVSWWTM